MDVFMYGFNIGDFFGWVFLLIGIVLVIASGLFVADKRRGPALMTGGFAIFMMTACVGIRNLSERLAMFCEAKGGPSVVPFGSAYTPGEIVIPAAVGLGIALVGLYLMLDPWVESIFTRMRAASGAKGTLSSTDRQPVDSIDRIEYDMRPLDMRHYADPWRD